MSPEALQHIPIAAALIGGQLVVLGVAWRFVLWVRGIVRDELRPITQRVKTLEDNFDRLPCLRAIPNVTPPLGFPLCPQPKEE